MSQTATANQTGSSAIATIVATLLQKLEKTGRLIYKPTDNKAALAHLDNAPGFSPVNWTEKAPESWEGVAIVNTKGKKGEQHVVQTRVIKFPDMETVFADNGMRSMLYDRYISLLVRAVSHPEAEEAAFASIGGPWAEEGNKAYTFQAEAWVSLMLAKSEDPEALKKLLNTRTLKAALESAEYAKARFSGVPQTRWVTILNAMKSKAVQAGFSPSMFDHYLATRDMVADAKKIAVNLDDNTEALLASLGPTKQAA